MLATAPVGPTGATASLPRHPRAARQARQVLETVSASEGVLGYTAALLLSEVVSNAVRHSEGATLQLAVTWQETDRALVVAVFDCNAHMRDGVRSRDGAADDLETGRGIDLLDALADDWGVSTVGDSGKWVWFRLTQHADDAPAGR